MDIQKYILVINCGSSSMKFALYRLDTRECVGNGAITGIGVKPALKVKGAVFESSTVFELKRKDDCRTPADATVLLITYLRTVLPVGSLAAVGHRTLHGGDMHNHALVTPENLEYLRTLIPLGPLHQPHNLAPMDELKKIFPDMPQVACFDTAFHTTAPEINVRLGIPRKWHDQGIRRYGFHGLSYEYIASRLKEVAPRAYAGKTVIAHLGNGSSCCALKEGKSYDSSMGFSALEGLLMGTRTGSIDPGVLLYFMDQQKMDVKQLSNFLYKECGLLGVSGVSSDVSELLASADPHAAEALDYYCHRANREIGALTAVMGGINALTFTAGIGEHAVPVRAKIVEKMSSWTGAKIDPYKNAEAVSGQEMLISSPDSKIDIWVIPTDEESIIVKHTCELAFGA